MVNKDGQFIDDNTGEIIDAYSITTIELVRAKIISLKRGSKSNPKVIFSELNGQHLLRVFEDNLTYYGENDYGNYLKSIEDDLAPLFEAIQYASLQETVDMAFSKLITLLNSGSPLLFETEEEFETYGE